jgi:hypothetical protein
VPGRPGGNVFMFVNRRLAAVSGGRVQFSTPRSLRRDPRQGTRSRRARPSEDTVGSRPAVRTATLRQYGVDVGEGPREDGAQLTLSRVSGFSG